MSTSQALSFTERVVLAVLAFQDALSAREIRRWATAHLDLLAGRPELKEIYAVLEGLERSAHVRSRVQPLDEVRRTRAFSITDGGRRALRQSVVRSLVGRCAPEPADAAGQMFRCGASRRRRAEHAFDELTLAQLAVEADSRSSERPDEHQLLSERLRAAGLVALSQVTHRAEPDPRSPP